MYVSQSYIRFLSPALVKCCYRGKEEVCRAGDLVTVLQCLCCSSVIAKNIDKINNKRLMEH